MSLSGRIQAIKASTDMRLLVPGAYTTSEDAEIRCPFHAENSASCRVNKDRLHCFGCGEHLDAIDYIRKTRGMNVMESLRYLEAGEVISIYESAVCKPQDEPKMPASRILSINRQVQHLISNPYKFPQHFKDYAQSRVSEDTIATFGLGYMSNNSLEELDCPQQDLIDAGLLNPKTGSNWFAHRLMIPLVDKRGDILGFAGRGLDYIDYEMKPKYINTPTNALYKKGNYLYGWQTADRMADEKHQKITVVEGYFDVFSLHEKRHGAILAIGSTQLTAEQWLILEEETNHVELMLDGDRPGLMAIGKNMHSSPEALDNVWAIMIHDGLDPATMKVDTKTSRIDWGHWFASADSLVLGNKRLVNGLFHELTKQYVYKNAQEGYAQLNVIDWVCLAYPEYAADIKLALSGIVASKKDTEEEQRTAIKTFLKAWFKPCRDIRKHASS